MSEADLAMHIVNFVRNISELGKKGMMKISSSFLGFWFRLSFIRKNQQV